MTTAMQRPASMILIERRFVLAQADNVQMLFLLSNKAVAGLTDNVTQSSKSPSEDSHVRHNDQCWSKYLLLEMWANAQRNGRPAEYRWRPMFNAAVWLCSNAAKTLNPLKLAGVPQNNETISAASGLKLAILWGHVEEILLLNKFFFRLLIRALVAKM